MIEDDTKIDNLVQVWSLFVFLAFLNGENSIMLYSFLFFCR